MFNSQKNPKKGLWVADTMTYLQKAKSCPSNHTADIMQNPQVDILGLKLWLPYVAVADVAGGS